MSRSWNNIFKSIESIRHEIVRTFDNAAKFHWSHEKLLDERGEYVLARPDYTTLPRWAKHELDGVWWALDHLNWRKLVFTYLHNGVRYALGTPEYRAIPVMEINTDTGAYAWRDDINALFTGAGDHLKKHEDTDASTSGVQSDSRETP